MEYTCLEPGFREPGVKQERDLTENEDSAMIHHHQLNKSTSYDDNVNIECHNTQVLSYPECINKSDDMIDIEYNTQTQMLDDVKFDISETLDNIGDENTSVSDVGKNLSSSDVDIPMRTLRYGKRVKLNKDTENDPAVKKRRVITLSQQHGNTSPAAALHKERHTFSCPHCYYNTTNKYQLKAHSKVHTSEKPFSCDKCNHKYSLKQHSVTHTSKKLFVCDKCDFKFKRKISSKQHLLTHTDEKPFSCDLCDFKCNPKTNLNQNLLIHTAEKPFSCNKCDFKCKHKISLKQHLLTHTDEKPFTCDKSDFKCKHKSTLKQHLFTHTGEKPFSCDECDFKSSSNHHNLNSQQSEDRFPNTLWRSDVGHCPNTVPADVIQHLPTELPQLPCGKTRQTRTCACCKKRRTSYFCVKCNVALCFGRQADCYRQYHL